MNLNIEPRLIAIFRNVNVLEALEAAAMEFETEGITLRLEKKMTDEQAVIQF